ncbi:MAG: beta-propeller fold lactonase family protein [Alphaproteobacteria bacterium]|nr:beta-propeller fold lactonase family protein [Alphaproteobacteria bacterium]
MSSLFQRKSVTIAAFGGLLLGSSALALAHDQAAAHVHISPDQLKSTIFVPNRASADVAVIDTQSEEVIAHVPVGSVPHQVAISAERMKMVTSNTADNTVTITDLGTLQPAGTIELGHEPEHMEIGPDGDLVAIANIGAGTVSLVSLETDAELARIDGLYEPHNMTFNRDGSLLYVGNLGADVVSVIDVAKAEVIDEIQVDSPQAVASQGDGDGYQGIINVTSTVDGRFGFAAFGEGDAMAVIDLDSRETIKTLALGDLPWRAYSTADGRYMITPNNGDQTVSIVSTESLEEVARLPGAADMTGVNTGMFETTAFVISRGDDKLLTIDLDSLSSAGEIALPGTPETGVATPDGKKLYVALSSTDQVAVIDMEKRALIKTIGDVGDEPWGAHMTGAMNYCH